MDTQAIINKGELLFQQGKLREAEEQFLIVIEYDPENKDAHNNLGVIAHSEMEHEKAISHFKKALAIDPSYKDAILNLCDVLQSTNNLVEARPIIEKALEQNPENGELIKRLKDLDSVIMMAKSKEDKEHIDNVQIKPSTPKTTAKIQKPLKVIHLPLIIANNAIALSKYLNLLGVDSKVISYFRTWLNYQGDINLGLDGLNIMDRNKKVREYVDYFFENEAHKYDIFHFHFFDSLSTGTSFGGWKSHPEREDYWDLQKLKGMGKKIVVSSWGSDVRNNSKIIYYQMKFEDPELQIPYPPLNHVHQYLKTWKFAQYADAIICGDSTLLKHVPYGTMIPIPIDLELFEPLKNRADKNDKMSILYAPSNQLYKGTKYTEKALERISQLYKKKVEIRKITGMPYHEAIKLYPGAGLAIDDLHISVGLFGLEAMYLGRNVACSQRKDELLAIDPKFDLPVVAVNCMKEFSDKLVEAIENYHDYEPKINQDIIDEKFSAASIAKSYRELYEKILANEHITSYVSQQWMREYASHAAGEKIDKDDYYPIITDILLKKNDLERLLHELQWGSGLNDLNELLAKSMFACELSGQQITVSELRKRHSNIMQSESYRRHYSRAREIWNAQ